MQPCVLVCRCERGGLVDQQKLRTLEASLKQAAVPYTAVPDLCRLAADGDLLLKKFAAHGSAQVLACYPRAVEALFSFAGAPLNKAATRFVNLRAVSEAQALAAMGIEQAQQIPEPASSEQTAEGGGWMPWFPVIDYQRCTNCQQCLGFCLFGVYALSPAGQVTVLNPQSCKTNCPACARICPEAAIIFPKYEYGAVAGAEITDELGEKSRIEADQRKILGSDIYAALAQRRRKVREKRLLKTNPDQAYAERRQHLQSSGMTQAPVTGNSPELSRPQISGPPDQKFAPPES